MSDEHAAAAHARQLDAELAAWRRIRRGIAVMVVALLGLGAALVTLFADTALDVVAMALALAAAAALAFASGVLLERHGPRT